MSFHKLATLIVFMLLFTAMYLKLGEYEATLSRYENGSYLALIIIN